MTRDSARPLGVVYTPREVAAAMVELALAPLVAGKRAEEILALRVCDPAIGEGVFLVEAVRVLADALVQAWEREAPTMTRAAREHGIATKADRDAAADASAASHRAPPLLDASAPGDRDAWGREARAAVVARCIVGVDIDARAVAAAREALGAGEDVLRVEDATTLDWARVFPEDFARGGFDLVVGNPPYIRQERLGSKAALRGYATYHGVADLYVYFIELAHRVLRPRGRYCLIVPNKWLTVAYARPLRAFLAEQASVEGVVDLSRAKLFADADAFPCIVWGAIGSSMPRGPIVAARPDGDTPVARALRDAEAMSAAHAPSAHTTSAAALLPRVAWGAEPWHIESSSERALLARIEARWPRLREVVPGRASRGVVTGLNRAFVIDRETRARLLEQEPGAAVILRPFVKGRDVRSWRVEEAGRWLLLIDRGTEIDRLPAVREHLAQFREALAPKPAGWEGAWNGRKPGAYAWYELQDPVGPLVKTRGPRLLFQDIQTAPACALDETGELAPDTTVWMLPTSDRVVLAILNSPLYGWYAKRRFPPALNGAVRPKLEYMRALPIAQASSAMRSEIEGLVEQRLELAASTRGAERERMIAKVSTRGAELDAAIAHAIYELYELSSEERRTVEGT